jgi:hypothetical protein
VAAAPVELTIALSIVFLASELLRDPLKRSHITQNYPWLVAFCFGLLHGLGFAGALAEIGLPHGKIPLALFAFNVGVELGQPGFVPAILSAAYLTRILLADAPSWAPRAAAYAMYRIVLGLRAPSRRDLSTGSEWSILAMHQRRRS